MNGAIPHVATAGAVEITSGIVFIRERSGERELVTARSVKAVTKLRDRIDRALERYANGEENIIEDG